MALAALLLAIFTRDAWWLILAPLSGYGFAWYAHFKVEHNRPETFGHPFWSLISDYRMYFLWLFSQLDRHLAIAGVDML